MMDTTAIFPHRHAARPLWRCLCCILVCLLTLTALVGGSILPAQALEEAPSSPEVGAALLCNLENDLILYEREADTPLYPSSSVKIMTGLLACRALRDRLDETVTVSSAMLAGVSGRRLHLADGEMLTVRDLLYAAICGSYNDAAAVLACLTSGSVSDFVVAMNREAERLGAVSTRYTNPTGLHDPAMSTSVRDIAAIAREAYADDLYMTVSSARTYTLPATNASDERIFSNRNALLSDTSRQYYNGYCRGLNAGMTDEGGWCVVTVCEQGGARNLCVVMQGADVPTGEVIPAYAETNRLLDWASRNYTYRTILDVGDVVETLPVGLTGISKSCADLVPTAPVAVYLPADADPATELTVTTELTDGELAAPLQAGEVIGTVTVRHGDRVVGRGELTVTEDFERNAFVGGMMAFRTYLCGRAFWIGVGIFVVLLLPFLHMTSPTHGRYGIRSAHRRRRVRYTKRRY